MVKMFLPFCQSYQTQWFITQGAHTSMMAGYRTRIEIIADILATARDYPEDEYGTTVTYLLKRTNMSHPRITGTLKMLVRQGLMEMDGHASATNRYRISSNGREFLQAYRTFTEFASDYGLNL